MNVRMVFLMWGSLTPVKPECEQSSKVWRAAVLAKKQAILDERNKHLPTNINPTPEVDNFKPNIVEVVDKSYINRRFKVSSKNDEKIVADSISFLPVPWLI